MFAISGMYSASARLLLIRRGLGRFVSKIIVSCYDKAEQAYKDYRPEYVVSILGKDEGPSRSFDGLSPEKLLEVRGDCSSTDDNAARCQKLIDLARNWDRRGPILIHCHQGVARSMAAAYILLCAAQEGRCETQIARELRKAAPHADPNILLISEADALMGREDRMVEAILDLCPCAGAVSDDIVILPVAA